MIFPDRDVDEEAVDVCNICFRDFFVKLKSFQSKSAPDWRGFVCDECLEKEKMNPDSDIVFNSIQEPRA